MVVTKLVDIDCRYNKNDSRGKEIGESGGVSAGTVVVRDGMECERCEMMKGITPPTKVI